MIATCTLPGRGASLAANRAHRALSIGAAVLATGLLWLASRALGITLEVDFHNGEPAQILGPGLLLGFTLQVSLLGWATLAVLERFTREAVRIWTGLGIAALLLSFVPVAAVGASAGTKAVLSLIHVAVAAVVLTLLRRSSLQRVPRQPTAAR